MLGFFDYVLNSVLTFIDSKEFENEFEAWEIIFGKLEAMKDRLEEEDFVVDDNEESMEIAIIFDNKCSCNTIFVGNPDERKEIENENEYSDPDVSITKYIGPKKTMVTRQCL